jgi:hypothetical protein
MSRMRFQGRRRAGEHTTGLGLHYIECDVLQQQRCEVVMLSQQAPAGSSMSHLCLPSTVQLP